MIAATDVLRNNPEEAEDEEILEPQEPEVGEPGADSPLIDAAADPQIEQQDQREERAPVPDHEEQIQLEANEQGLFPRRSWQ
jgi:hypothetical protein